MTPGPLLICYDGSDDARRAVDAAAKLLVERTAVMLAVAAPTTAMQALDTLGTVPQAPEEVNLATAVQRAEEGADYARRAGLTAEVRGEIAAPTWKAIVHVADELDAAVIVIGSRGLKGVRKIVEGTLSHEVAQHTGRPVLIVPAGRPY
jgi:nucleotide-binding universal stress UspA family protein